jgi:hypothetical protein
MNEEDQVPTGRPVGRRDRLAADSPYTSVRRTGGGSLAGRITWTDDWDSAETNQQIARDFGLLP